MLPTVDHISRVTSSAGQNPGNGRANAERRPARKGLLAVRAAFLCAAMAAGLAAPASAEGFLRAKKPIAPPAGFSGVCLRYDWACASGTPGNTASEGLVEMAFRVNRHVNGTVRQTTDRSQYGRNELWTLPTARGGDCEDIALLKKHELVRQGVAPNRLLIATVLDRSRRPHAVLVLRAPQGDLVLDNLTDRILSWDSTGYSFIRMQDPDEPRRWTAVFAGGVFRTSNL